MNVVMTGVGGLVEVQGTAEGAPFSREELDSHARSRRKRHQPASRRPGRGGCHSAPGAGPTRIAYPWLSQGTFVLATTNPNKAREIREIFAACDLGIELVDRPPSMRGGRGNRGRLCSATPASRPRALVEATGIPAIAEDTGIEVEALAGAPGVRSARYAGEPSDDEANVDKVLTELSPGSGRRSAGPGSSPWRSPCGPTGGRPPPRGAWRAG